jgi:hypothetical protein
MKRIMICLIVFLTGCSSSGPNGPRIRLSPYFGSDIKYPDPNDLCYCYGGSFSEKIGLVYTAKGGFIDTGHMIESVDRTKYVFETARKNIQSGKTEFSFNLVEPARYFITVKYPDSWTDENAREVSIELAQYISQRSTDWHEIITWFGYSCVLIFSEKTSSFSWEDLYSDLLGSEIAVQALRENSKDFNKRVSEIIRQRLLELNAQSPAAAKRAVKKIEGKWFSGFFYPFIKMKKRNFDIGLDDGSITPWLVPGVCRNEKPKPLLIPQIPSRYGFSFKVRLKPEGFQKNKILSIVHNSKKEEFIEPDRDYPKILSYIENQAKKEDGKKVDSPTLSARL